MDGGRNAGFTLLELLLALLLGVALGGQILQAVVGDVRLGRRLGRSFRERAVQRRTLELLRGELLRAETVARQLPPAGAACGLGGRQVVLHLGMGDGRVPITYTLGPGPSPIWRGTVLMRCGPAYGLDGLPGSGQAQSRVLLDGLAEREGFVVEELGAGVLRLRLRQRFEEAGGAGQQLEGELLAPGGLQSSITRTRARPALTRLA